MRTSCGGLAVFLALLLSGCATVTRGIKDEVRIESVPAGAAVRTSNGLSGRTPVTFALPRKHPVHVELELAGYEKAKAVLTPQTTKAGRVATTGNVLIGGLIGAGIDAGTGARLDLFPNPLVVHLKALRAKDAPVEWARMRERLARSEVRDRLGEPAAISDATGNQVWTYADGGKVYFSGFFSVRWEAPPPPAVVSTGANAPAPAPEPAPAATANPPAAAAVNNPPVEAESPAGAK